MSKLHGSESRPTQNLRVPKILIEQMKSDGFRENFGYYLEEIYCQSPRKYMSGEIISGCASHSSAVSEREKVLDLLEKWLYEEGMAFEKICDSEENYLTAASACSRRAQCYYTIKRIEELRQGGE